MSKPIAWIALEATTIQSNVEILEEILYSLNASSITLCDAGESPILEPAPQTTPHWPTNRLTALFSASGDRRAVDQQIAELRQGFQQAIAPFAELKTQTFSFSTLEDENWVGKSLARFTPLRFDNRLFVHSGEFEATKDNRDASVLLDPGLAFGTGAHPTTFLCLGWLDQQLRPGERVIDYGCGSGILGIAALKLGASQVVFVDNDPQALTATQNNIEKNSLTRENAILIDSSTDEGSHALQGLENAGADLLLANILYNTLTGLSDSFCAMLKPDGKVVLSGILDPQCSELEKHYSKLFHGFESERREGWSRLSAIKK